MHSVVAHTVVCCVVAVATFGCSKSEPPTPFDAHELGKSLVACKELCSAEAKCPIPPSGSSDCGKACETLLEVQIIAEQCDSVLTRALSCWWHQAQRCAEQTACADEVGRAWDCVCGLPNAPASCRPTGRP